MTAKDMIKDILMSGTQGTTMDLKASILALGVSLLLALYLFVIYKMFVRKTLYNVNLNLSIVGMTIIVAAIMLTIQTNLILSLGMVGALSIVRYRTAVKDPMDLLFLFWSIGSGIMCGAAQYTLAFLVAVIMTLVILILSQLPTLRAPFVLVVNGDAKGLEDALEPVLDQFCKHYKVKSRSIQDTSERMIIELKVSAEKELLDACAALEEVSKVSLLTYEGDIVC